LQAPVALQEVINNGPLFANPKISLNVPLNLNHLTLKFSDLKRIARSSSSFFLASQEGEQPEASAGVTLAERMFAVRFIVQPWLMD
jgi:hypothetical protein